jgi:short-subunit dehydrogenase
MIITGNPQKGLAHSLHKIYPGAVYCSRASGYELTDNKGMDDFAQLAAQHDTIIINSALWRFHQTVLLDLVYKACKTANNDAHIVCIGSTTDKTNKGSSWMYNAEKKALRDYCNSLGLIGVWHSGPKISYISFGTLSNNQEKHPDRKCLDIDEAASYIKWLIDQPKHVTINEISIDPMQERQQ